MAIQAVLDHDEIADEEQELGQSLASGFALLQELRPKAVILGDLTLPDLPDPPLAAAEDIAALKSVAPLYLTMELEATGLTKAGGAIAGLFTSGALRLSPGPGADLLIAYHRNYENRLSSDDRQAAYLRLFGLASDHAVPFALENAINTEFEELFLGLAEAMHQLANMHPLRQSSISLGMQVKQHARAVGLNLLRRSGGVSTYIAEEALAIIADVAAIFKAPDIQRALRVRTLWDGVAATLAMASGQPLQLHPQRTGTAHAHLRRGKAGLSMIKWLSDQAPLLAAVRGFTIASDDPVLASGTSWLEATLDLLSRMEP